jgi:hypothetical protein
MSDEKTHMVLPNNAERALKRKLFSEYKNSLRGK